MVKREDIDLGTITLNDIEFLMSQNNSRAGVGGLELCWRHEGGLYWGIIKERGKVLFRAPTYQRTLIKALIAMHLDFRDYLDSQGLRKV